MHEAEQEEAFEDEFEIIDLNSEQNSSQVLNWWLDGQRLALRTRLWMALLTVMGVVLFSWLLVSRLHLTGVSHLENASTDPTFMRANGAPSGYAQMLVVRNVIYLIGQDGLVRAIWTRKKYTFQLWHHYVAPFSKLLKVEGNVVYLAAPDGRIVALRASDGVVLWSKGGK